MVRMVTVQLEDGAKLQCGSPAELAIHPGDQCIIEDRRIAEFGRVLQIEERADTETPRGNAPVVLRRATLQDQSRASENAVVGRMSLEVCKRRVAEQKLDVRILYVRYCFDRTLLTITYSSEERVDFREIVRRLGTELNVRIEMKQLGVRDAARCIGGMAVCGRPLCCASWLRAFDAVSVKMAKAQRLSLNPGAISGMCGRLKCCLRFEYETYRQLGQEMPRDKAKVQSPEGKGEVIDVNLITRRVKVYLEDRRVLEFDAGQLQEIAGAAARTRTEEGKR